MIWIAGRRKRALARELAYLREDIERLRRDLWCLTYGSDDTFVPGTESSRPWSRDIELGPVA